MPLTLLPIFKSGQYPGRVRFRPFPSIRVIFSMLILLLPFTSTAQVDQYLDHLYDKSLAFDTSRLVLQANRVDSISSEDEWRDWHTVDNYFFGKNRGSLPMIADLESLHPYFKDKVVELIRVCEAAGIELAVVESYRTHAKQAEYFAMGKKYTRTAGGSSRHQYGLAVDVVPMIDSKPVWNNARLWKKIGLAGERLGLRWGGRWRIPYDPAHFEWLGGISSYQLAKGYLPSIPTSRLEAYPCLEEDLKTLRTYWEAWEVEQSVFAKYPAPDRAEQR